MSKTGRPAVFVIENLSFIQHFLTLYDPATPTTVIATDHAINKSFFKDFLRITDTWFVPSRMMWGPKLDAPPPRGWIDALTEIGGSRPVFTNLAAGLPTDAVVHWWHYMSCMPLFAVLAACRAQGLETLFCDSAVMGQRFGHAHLSAQASRELGIGAWPEFLDRATKAIGLPQGITVIEPLRDGQWTYTGVGPLETAFGPRVMLDLDDWDTLAANFASQVERLLGPRDGRHRVLLADDDLSSYRGVDGAASDQRITAWFRRRLDEGCEVHVKPHPNKPDHLTLTDPDVAARVVRLPAHLPAELLTPHYDEVCFCLSSTAFRPMEAKRTCLFPLMRFATDEGERYVRDVLDAGLGAGWPGVTLAADDDASVSGPTSDGGA